MSQEHKSILLITHEWVMFLIYLDKDGKEYTHHSVATYHVPNTFSIFFRKKYHLWQSSYN